MAQLGARLDGIEEVVGSNPIGSTKLFGNSEIPKDVVQSMEAACVILRVEKLNFEPIEAN